MEESKTLDYETMAETDLVSHAKLGSPMAFSELYTRSYQAVFNYISLWLKQWDSEDIAQEAFLRAQQYISGFKGDSSFATWVRSIAEQLVIQNHRNTPEFVPLDENILPVQEPEDVLQSLQKQKILSLLETFVKTLPEAQRETFELRIQKGLSYEAISQKTGKKVRTLWKTCQRVHNKWRKYYKTAFPKESKLQKNSR